MSRIRITTKITIWYALFMMLLAAVLVAVLLRFENMEEEMTVTGNMTEIVADASEQIAMTGNDFIVDEDLDLYLDYVYISVYDEDGQMLEGMIPIDCDLPEFRDKEIQKIESEDGEWYIYDSEFIIDGKSAVIVRGITAASSISTKYTNLYWIIAVLMAGLLVLAIIGGFLITRRAFRPVREITETAHRIQESGSLSTRVELPAGKDEIYELSSTFNDMLDELELTMEGERRFTADMSHEMKTPLAVVLTQSEYAISNPLDAGPALEVIRREAGRMSNLVNRLGVLSKSEAGRLNFTPEMVDMTGLVEAVAFQQEQLAENRGAEIILDAEENISLLCDESLMIRILLNLTDNALKYGCTGGLSSAKPTVNIRLYSDGEEVHCLITDSGQGIPEEKQPLIWNRFYRVDEARDDENSSGLGLAIVKALTELQGGRVSLESREGEGSTFGVHFPAVKN